MRNRRKRPITRAFSAGASGVGGTLGGPAGAALGKMLEELGEDFVNRVLSNAERRRTVEVFGHVREGVQRRLNAGESPRSDDFFTAPREMAAKLSAPWGTLRPPAWELLEAALLNAGRTYEERKLPFKARLVEHALFDEKIPPAYAHQLERLANTISYRQYCLLGLFGHHGLHPGFTDPGLSLDPDSSAGLELEELARLGLVGAHNPGGDGDYLDSVLELGFGYMGLTRHGRRLHDSMGLDELPEQELFAAARELQAHGASGR